MGIVFRLVELLLVLLPMTGMIFAAVKTWQRAQRPPGPAARPELEPTPATVGRTTPAAPASPASLWRTITRTIDEHARTDTRWMAYELDTDKLLDFPLMTDMRNPLTTAFHKAKLGADLLRPAQAEHLLDDRESAAQYLAAVQDYVTAFDVAEAEAIRRRRSDFSPVEQQRIVRARSLLNVASDSAATPSERAQAYARAGRELDGLVVLPSPTLTAIERRIAGQLDG